MTRPLDSLRPHFYKARPLGAVLLALWATASGAELVNGAQIPDGAQKVGENRYRASRDFEATLDYYKNVYPTSSYPRRSVVNQPGVKAVHISNPSGKNFEGLNIYEANDEVRIYVVPLQGSAKPAKKSEGKPVRKTK
ncbi:hypothetical protein KH5H1_03580 [Corallococcus caeni]|uniref:Uncharacterized protein n=2 Tax=Corallococcus TaxID=83461 RepID=A0A7Y4JZL6_9BACT|nr:hypothetical protein [Corallococcus exercitus]NOK14149.1 hypothetical protein [Corallococcus exercitus]GMT96239.1 hypothetical protein KH5H1_03580 [Corallococcus sp. KH5-1]GMU08080.1 hypothetical protein ASNO1_43330 [Corallococcus sp. NO1]